MTSEDSASRPLSTFDRLFRVGRTLLSVHIEAATAEAARDRDRLISGAALAITGTCFFAILLMMLHVVAIAALHELGGLRWLLSSLAVTGGDLLLMMICLLAARSRLKKPLLAKTRVLLQRTVDSFVGEVARRQAQDGDQR